MDYPESFWQFLIHLFSSNDFAPHGHCYLWRSEIVWLHVVSDFLIALSYYSIPLALLYFIRKRHDVEFRSMFIMFGAFILACGTTHLMSIITVWTPVYRFDGVVKAVTALLSLTTAVALWRLMPVALRVPSPSQLQVAIWELHREINERKHVEEELRLQTEIVANMAEGVCLIRARTGEIIYANATFERMFGYGPEELHGKPVSVVNAGDGDDAETIARKIMAHLDQQGSWSGEIRNQKKDGTPFWCRANISRFEHGEYGVVYVAVHTDITESKRVEDAMAYYSSIVYSSNDAIVGRTIDGLIASWNPGAERMFGYSVTEVIAQPGQMLVPADRMAELNELLDRIRAGETVAHFETVRRCKDGRRLDVSMTLSPIRDKSGKIVGISSIARDITKRRQTEQELAKEQNLLRSLIENIPDHIYVKDVQGRYILDNPAHARFLGTTPAKVIGKRVFDFYPEPQASEFHADDMAVVQRGEPLVNKEEPLPSRDGNVLWVTTTKVPLMTPDGRVAGIVCLSRDTTERKSAQEALQRTAAELARSNAELQQFAYVASHDLQEPLRVVASYLQLLERQYKGKLDAEADDFIQRAVQGAKRMQRLIEDLLEYSRVGSRGGEFVSVPSSEALTEALSNLETAIHESAAKITSDRLPTVSGDGSQLAQLFQNLIGNALKFHSQKPPQVHVGARRQNGDWVFSVHDNGIGIDPQYRDRIFLIFQRLHTRTEYPGTGVGLAICKKIVERHGGKIWVESQPGEGTTFYFTLSAEKELAA